MQLARITLLVATLTALSACAADRRITTPAPRETTTMQQLDVLDSHIAYVEAGSGPSTIVLLHGNPTSSHVWRDVIPHLSDGARCLAPDLIGMGTSGKPDIPYRFADHARYLDAWFDGLGLRDVVLVGYDWGGALAMDWAARHPDRVRGLVVFQTFLREMRWDEWTAEGRQLFRALRTPGVGERMVLLENQFLPRSLEHGVLRGLTAVERAVYQAPYPDAASRRPLLQWPREIPIDGEPADVAAAVRRYGEWLASSASTPKLLLTFDAPSVLGSPAVNAWAREHVVALDVVALGRAGHHAPEDLPTEIGQAIARWLRERPAAAARRGLAIEPARDAQMRVRIDSFAVPDGVRVAFHRQMAEVLAFLSTLDGYRGHVVFEKRDGASRYDVITIVAWDSSEAQERAGGQVRAFFQSRRLDIPRQLEEWGVEMLRADYDVPARLQ